MSIWEYDHSRAEKEIVQQAVNCTECLFCAEPLETLVAEEDSGENPGSPDNWFWYMSETRVRTCPVCGWWSVCRTSTTAGGSHGTHHEMGASGSLRELDLPDIEGPLEEVRSYLAARYVDRFKVHPRVFEETVASVFRDLGYNARVTAYSGDDGIDVILDGQSGNLIGVQVKRYRNSIQVEQIRALTGALVLGGLTRGIFVTTSTFQSGANETAQRLRTRGYQIELMDAARFYDSLKIAQRTRYRSKNDPTAPYTHAQLIDLHSSYGTY